MIIGINKNSKYGSITLKGETIDDLEYFKTYEPAGSNAKQKVVIYDSLSQVTFYY